MIKINKLEIENVKRVKAVAIEPTPNGLTVIGGKNGQGKTSVLDAIAWALGGDKYRPSQAQRDDSVLPPDLRVQMSNGLIVERRGKNSTLKVTDPAGRKGGQQLLNEFVEQPALDLPQFMQASSRDKADTLLRIIGVQDQLAVLNQQEQQIYTKRHAIGQIADQKAKYAKEQPYYPDTPKEPVSAAELIKQQQEILARNGENQRLRDKALQLHAEKKRLVDKVSQLEEVLAHYQKLLNQTDQDLTIAYKSAEDLFDESTAEIEKSIEDIDDINRRVRANLDKEKAETDAKEYGIQYDNMTSELDDIRKKKADLLQSAPLPLPGLSVEGGELTYNGYRWDGISGSDQLKISTAIVRKLNPKCGFVLLDKLEQMDVDTLYDFGKWLEAEGLQAIATRVSTGGECQIIIEDGQVVGAAAPEPAATKWKAGAF